MRKVIFTESQIKRIVEQGFGGAYNSEEKYGSGEICASNPEVSAQDIDGDPIDSDELGHIETQNGYPYGTFSGKHMFESKKKSLQEQNSELKNSSVVVPDRIISQMPDSKQKNNIINNGGVVSVNTADQIMHRSNENGTNGQLNKFFKHQLKSKRDNVKTIKKSKAENGFIKPHEKKGTGTAHTKKPQFTFTYEY